MKLYREQPEGDYFYLGLCKTVGVEKQFNFWFTLSIPVWFPVWHWGLDNNFNACYRKDIPILVINFYKSRKHKFPKIEFLKLMCWCSTYGK